MPERDGSYGNCLRGWLAGQKSRGDIICVKGWRGRYGIVARLSLLRSRENTAALRLSPYASFSGAEGRFKVSPIGRVDSSSSIVLEFFRFRLFISRESKGKLEERKNSCRLYYVESLARKKNIYIYIFFPLFTSPRKRGEKQRWKSFLSPFLALFHHSRPVSGISPFFPIVSGEKEYGRYYIVSYEYFDSRTDKLNTVIRNFLSFLTFSFLVEQIFEYEKGGERDKVAAYSMSPRCLLYLARRQISKRTSYRPLPSYHLFHPPRSAWLATFGNRPPKIQGAAQNLMADVYPRVSSIRA